MTVALIQRVAAAIVLAVVIFAPLLPLAFCVEHGPTYVDRQSLSSLMNEEDIAAVLDAVREHEELGWSFRQEAPRFISVADYFFTYDEVGVLSIEVREAGDGTSAAVRVGITCGELCGGGELYCVKRAGGSWEAEPCGRWVG